MAWVVLAQRFLGSGHRRDQSCLLLASVQAVFGSRPVGSVIHLFRLNSDLPDTTPLRTFRLRLQLWGDTQTSAALHAPKFLKAPRHSPWHCTIRRRCNRGLRVSQCCDARLSLLLRTSASGLVTVYSGPVGKRLLPLRPFGLCVLGLDAAGVRGCLVGDLPHFFHYEASN